MSDISLKVVYSTFKIKYDCRNLDLVEAQSLSEITAMTIVKAAAVQIAPCSTAVRAR